MFNLRIIGAVCAALFLAACSGGGGGGASKQVASTSTTYLAQGPQVIIKRLISYYTDGSQSTTDVTGFSQGSLAVDTNDHVTVTGNFDLILAGKETLVGAIVEPSISTAPILAKENYPSDWTTTGAVTKPSVSQAKGTFLDGVAYAANGSASAPFRQATLTPNGPSDKTTAINDPNAYVKAPKTGVYDLRWGTPDPLGPQYANNFNQGNSQYTLPASIKIFGAILSANTSTCKSAAANVLNCGPTLPAPASDVIDAWNKGWTGKGQNILIFDDIGASPISPHAATVGMIAQRYAWGATLYGVTNGINVPLPYNFNILNNDGSLAQPTSSIQFSAINMSWGADLEKAIGRTNDSSNPWTVGELLTQRTDYQTRYSAIAAALNNTSFAGPDNTSVGTFDLSRAVLVKSAGNDSIDASYEPLNYWSSQNTDNYSRLLIVGALTGIGTPIERVSLANYSNKAGADPSIQARFLTESGTSLFGSVNDAYNGTALTSRVGTSYAAPRVAAYAAMVRQKFPNLTAANTADIMLATARYDTLSCYPNCDKAIYGQGEASLSRALAPVGYLR